MRNFLCFIAFLLTLAPAFGQTGNTVQGLVKSQEDKVKLPAGTTVYLVKAADSTTVKITLLQKDGSYSFESIPSGSYRVSASSVGYQKRWSETFTVGAQQPAVQVPALELPAAAKALSGVTVTATRPLIEQRIDRTVVNVEAGITNIGTSALEVLEKSPGVSVDREGNISLKGKEGVLVLVDGRPTQLGGADLANLLRNLNSSQLDQIEIMTNPPARFDAAGNAGVINIKTKKTATAGYNGTATLGYTQGRYPKSNEGINFNYRSGKVNVFTNLSHNYQKSFGILKFHRNIFHSNTATVDKVFDQRADRVGEGNALNGKVGLDFFATKKTTWGVAFSGNTRKMNATNQNVTNISSAAKILERQTQAVVNNKGDWNSFNANLNFRTVLDKKGRELTSDLDYLRYRSDNEQFMVNAYADPEGSAYQKADTLMGHLPQRIQVYSGRVDYIHPLKKNARFEAGVKTSWVSTDNDARYDSIQYGQVVHDFGRSNHFVYEEQVSAAYVNLSTPLSKKISAQLGLRLENTQAEGRQLTTGENFKRQYTQLFPTAFFQYKRNEKNTFGANFGRRVRRPSYQSLNPFIRFIDRYTFSQGNPLLKPSVSSNVELSHTWKNQITTTVNYTATQDIIDGVIEQRGQEAYNKPANISSLQQFGISVSANTPITKWWTSNLNVNVFNNNYKGAVSNTPVDLSATSFVLNGTQQFKISKTLTGELNGRYRNGWLEGLMRARSIGMVGLGLSQQVLKNRGTVRLAVRDLFYTQKFRGKSRYANVDFDFEEVNESRVVTVGFTYRFSKGKKIAPVKRTAGSAGEEQERVGQ